MVMIVAAPLTRLPEIERGGSVKGGGRSKKGRPNHNSNARRGCSHGSFRSPITVSTKFGDGRIWTLIWKHRVESTLRKLLEQRNDHSFTGILSMIAAAILAKINVEMSQFIKESNYWSECLVLRIYLCEKFFKFWYNASSY